VQQLNGGWWRVQAGEVEAGGSEGKVEPQRLRVEGSELRLSLFQTGARGRKHGLQFSIISV